MMENVLTEDGLYDATTQTLPLPGNGPQKTCWLSADATYR